MPPRNRRRLALGVALVIVPGVVIGVIVGVVLHAATVHAAIWYCVAITVLALALFRLGRAAIDDVELPERIRRGPGPVAGTEAGHGALPEVIGLLERRLSGASRERRLFVTGLQPILRELAADRLKLHHDITTDTNFDNARHLLGDELWHWMTTRDHEGPAPTTRQLEQMIVTLEQL